MRILSVILATLSCLAGVTTQAQADTQPVGLDSVPRVLLAVANPVQQDVQLPAMVSIPGRNYQIGIYEVTQGEWRAVMGGNPSKFADCGDDCPVEKVSWDDTHIYLQKLNSMSGRQYRLPSEAEWEFACHGGTQGEYCGGNNVDVLAWTDANAKDRTHPVGQKQANGYGLYDMSGNVMEWTGDCWDGDCTMHAFRGGSWINDARGARATSRIRFVASIRNGSGGLRLARTIP